MIDTSTIETIVRGVCVVLFINSLSPDLTIKKAKWWVAMLSLNIIIMI